MDQDEGYVEMVDRIRRVRPPPGMNGIGVDSMGRMTWSESRYCGEGEVYDGIGRFNIEDRDVWAIDGELLGTMWYVGVIICESALFEELMPDKKRTDAIPDVWMKSRRDSVNSCFRFLRAGDLC